MCTRLHSSLEKRRQGEGGFTLIELMVILFILAILMAVAIPVFLNLSSGAEDSAAQANAYNALLSAKSVYYAQNQQYPAAATLVSDLTATTPNYKFTSTYSTGPNVVSVASTADPVAVMSVLSHTGVCWVVVANEDTTNIPETAGTRVSPFPPGTKWAGVTTDSDPSMCGSKEVFNGYCKGSKAVPAGNIGGTVKSVPIWRPGCNNKDGTTTANSCAYTGTFKTKDAATSYASAVNAVGAPYAWSLRDTSGSVAGNYGSTGAAGNGHYTGAVVQASLTLMGSKVADFSGGSVQTCATVPGTSFSIVAWVNPSGSTPVGTGEAIVSEVSASGTTAHGFTLVLLHASDDYILGSVVMNGTDGPHSNKYSTNSVYLNKPLQAGTWTMVSVTFNGSVAQVYVGATAGTASAALPVSAPNMGSTPLIIGTVPAALLAKGYSAFSGHIGEVSAYSSDISGSIGTLAAAG